MTRVDRTEDVRSLLNPGSVAIIGANDRPGAWPERIRFNLRRFGFPGTIYPVNPKREQLWGGPCYASAADLPEPADHLIVLVPARGAVDAVRAGARAGSRSATIFSSGFTDGQLDELRNISADTGIAISGPNCLGNVSAAVPLVTTTDIRIDRIEDGSVAIAGQSGGVVTALHRALLGRGIGVRYMVSSGNETVLNTADYIRYFAQDDAVRVVATFVESLRDRGAFFAAADELAARGKRLVCLKVGRSVESQTAAASHTGALAGSYDAFRAVAAGHGIVTVPTMERALEACEFLSRAPAPGPGGVGVVAVSGGVRELGLDSADLHGATLTPLSAATEAAFSEIIGPEMEVSNPLDTGYAGLSDPANLVACVETMGDEHEVGMVLLQEELLGVPSPNKERAIALFNASFPGGLTRGSRVPVALFSMTSTNVTEFARNVRRDHPNLAFVQGVDGALALAADLQSSVPVVEDDTDSRKLSGDAAHAALAQFPGDLTEVEAKSLIQGFGIAHGEEVFAATPVQAAAWAAHRGDGPFVVKVVLRGLSHKSESGGVRLGLSSPAEVEATAQEILESHPGADGVIVARQIIGVVELIVGFQNDREVGPVIAVGLGGVAVELFDDAQFLRPGCTGDEIRAALDRSVAGRVLAGFRGASPGDRDAVVEAVRAVSHIAQELGDELESVEINPLMVLPEGQGVVALDAVCIRRGVHSEGR